MSGFESLGTENGKSTSHFESLGTEKVKSTLPFESLGTEKLYLLARLDPMQATYKEKTLNRFKVLLFCATGCTFSIKAENFFRFCLLE